MKTNGMDERNAEILALLRGNARLSFSEIGVQVGLSRTAVKNRMAAMEEAGIIKGYRAVIDPRELPERMTFIVNIETKPESFEEAKAIMASADETVTLVQTTGSCHLLAVCASESVDLMKAFVNRTYKTIPGIRSINCHTVLDVVKGDILSE